MRTALRFAVVALLLLFGIVVIAYGVIYWKSAALMTERFPLPLLAIQVPNDPASIEEGQRLATVHGCYRACHAEKAVGDVFIDDPMLGHITAPNLYHAIRQYSDVELARLIRFGVRPDGHGVLIMPSQTFHGLTDQDLGRIIAFLRTLPESDGPGRLEVLGPMARMALATGQFKPAPAMIAEAPVWSETPKPGARLGQYLAQTVCTECHGNRLQGDANPDFKSPDLHIVASYSQADFERLMRTGIALGGRNVGLMSSFAEYDFSQMTDGEIDSLYLYLHELGAADPAPAR
jgi:mono/diheme cytochrome c family protein